ncbi:MAG: cysteine desulfurase family protein [Candidatus Eiseniibacteriota bacterium]
MKRPVYLDAHATTPVDPRVLAAMLPCFTEDFGNAASRTHAYGWRAEEAVDRAREQAAALLGASPKEIVWTSGATESNNLALLGAMGALRERGDHLITCVTEHPSVLDPARELERRGFRVTRLPVDATGLLDLDALREALDERTLLVSVMTANNEIGTIQPVAEAAKVVHESSPALFHTDAAQAAGKLPIDVERDGIDLLSLAAHKIHGPKGVGALYVRRRRPSVRLEPVLFGGGHERGLRSGTLNVPGIVGLGAALEIAAKDMRADGERLRRLRDRLHRAIEAELDGVRLNGHPERRLPNNLNLSFDGVEAEALLNEIPSLAVSTGAACSSASPEPSHVIQALGFPDSRAQSSIRFGLHRFTTEDDVDFAAAEMVRAVRKLRAAAA